MICSAVRLGILFFGATLLFAVTSCDPIPKEKEKEIWKQIKIDRFSLSIPPDFQLLQNDGNAKSGVLLGKDLRINYALEGSPDTYPASPEEYMQSHDYEYQIQNSLLKDNIIYTQETMPRVNIISYRKPVKADSSICFNCDYIVLYEANGKTALYPIYLREESRKTHFNKTERNGWKIGYIIPRDCAYKPAFYYMHPPENSNRNGLYLTVSPKDCEQQNIAVRIFESVENSF